MKRLQPAPFTRSEATLWISVPSVGRLERAAVQRIAPVIISSYLQSAASPGCRRRCVGRVLQQVRTKHLSVSHVTIRRKNVRSLVDIVRGGGHIAAHRARRCIETRRDGARELSLTTVSIIGPADGFALLLSWVIRMGYPGAEVRFCLFRGGSLGGLCSFAV